MSTSTQFNPSLLIGDPSTYSMPKQRRLLRSARRMLNNLLVSEEFEQEDYDSYSALFDELLETNGDLSPHQANEFLMAIRELAEAAGYEVPTLEPEPTTRAPTSKDYRVNYSGSYPGSKVQMRKVWHKDGSFTESYGSVLNSSLSSIMRPDGRLSVTTDPLNIEVSVYRTLPGTATVNAGNTSLTLYTHYNEIYVNDVKYTL